MSLRFFNEEAKGRFRLPDCVLYFEFKYICLAVGRNADCISIFLIKQSFSPQLMYNLPIKKENVIKFWEEYDLTKKISDEFEKEIQNILDDKSSILLDRLNKYYLHPVTEYKDKLKEAEETYKEFNDLYSRELILI
jgi:preprotein translocase subunit Sec61beta